jgi:diguanylate cyclase (GGDEF)-like protein
MQPNIEPTPLQLNWQEQNGILHGFFKNDDEDVTIEIHHDRQADLYSASYSDKNINLDIEPTCDLEQLKNTVLRILTYDALTNVYNRRGFKRILEFEIKKSEKDTDPYSIILSDIDYFRQYNLTFGHNQGDVALVAIASLITNCVGSKGWVTRYSGDSFITILPEISFQEATHLAKKIGEAVQSYPFPFSEKHKTRIGISSGVACSNELDSKEPSDLMEMANQRLYEAKRSRNRNIAA